MINEFALIKRLGHISKTSKMPCYSWSLSAFDCIYKDPICLKYCYAKKHHYNYSNVKNALSKNKESYRSHTWVKDFTMFLNDFLNASFFRWFDSGDLPNIELLNKIGLIADQCPKIKFWLPTRAKEILKQYVKEHKGIKLNKLHPNLIIRLSASDVDTDPDYKLSKEIGVLMSTIKIKDYTCRAKANGGSCGSCRMCWNTNIKEVSYNLH